MAKKKTPAAKKKILSAHGKILAVAIGHPQNNQEFKSLNDPKLDTVRPYVKGLIYGLSIVKRKEIGDANDYTVDYREVEDATAFFNNLTPKPSLVFCMSRTVVEAASAKFPEAAGVPIVGIVSSPGDFNNNRNVFGISAQRSQKGRQYYDKFLDTVPHLKTPGQKIYVLNKKDYPPTEKAFAALPNSPDIVEIKVSSLTEIEAEIPKMTPGGLLILPADLFFGNAARIIELARSQKLPDFWPVTDWVKPTLPSALGGYGVPQLMCGELLADKIADYWDHSWPNQRFDVVDDAEVWMASIAAAIQLDVAIAMPRGLIHV
jgi:hypothetical protein